MISKIINLNKNTNIQKQHQQKQPSCTDTKNSCPNLLSSNLKMLAVNNLYNLNFKGIKPINIINNDNEKTFIDKLHELQNNYNNSSLSLKGNDSVVVDRVRQYVFDNKTNLHKTVGLIEKIIEIVRNSENAQTNLSLEQIKETLKNAKTSNIFVEILKNKIEILKTTKNNQYYNEKCEIAKKILNYATTPSTTNYNDLIQKYINTDLYYFYNLINLTSNQNNYIQEILNTIENTPQNKDEKLSQYLERILQQQIANSKKQKNDFDLSIKSKLSYTESEKENQEKNLVVTPYTHNLLAKTINNIYKTKKYDTDTSIEELSKLWADKYIDGIMENLEKNLSEIVFSNFQKHKPRKNHSEDSIFDYEPVYRWLKINDLDKFLSQFETEDSIYKYSKIQSCSKEKNYGEFNPTTRNVNFADWDNVYNVKFVIHPKNNSSNAVIIGDNKYGNSEVLFNSNQKFKYLGKIKHFVNPSDYEKLTEFDGQKHDPFYRWEIHLQET